MFNYIKNKLKKYKQRRTFQEYGFKLKTFHLPDDGEIQYAQWTHPFEGEKQIDQDEVNFIKNYIKPGDFVIDIGAHTGDSTIPLALAAGSTGCVLALEPNKYVFKILEKNAALNSDKTNIIPLNFASTIKNEKLTFYYSDASFCNGGDPGLIKKNHLYPLEVEGKNLTNYLKSNYADLLPRLSFLKVDAEGFDKEIIKTVKDLLLKHKTTLLSECYVGLSPEDRFEYFELLTTMGYQLYRLDGLFSNKMTPIDNKTKMLTPKHFDFLALMK
ncbi:FkbM family methyltransferase [Adhaeribacter pallidiroseus]|uniref:Methyltransferase FkbM domain-containing protein n=1 Tax=Adhaeribacter pallidiroseus TaxID=2072847 RepID=A0A369QE20_9BACT|nr:FkbM family methyltransferase [Adhaeribacter pallidiroseus]RDC61456.1 hypothetical protein AHMF7616_00035 [Adhaeribacter pallidiroseus]